MRKELATCVLKRVLIILCRKNKDYSDEQVTEQLAEVAEVAQVAKLLRIDVHIPIGYDMFMILTPISNDEDGKINKTIENTTKTLSIPHFPTYGKVGEVNTLENAENESVIECGKKK